jgi:acetylornithine/succinyldiaminopimelate/putrescine aminotransferase
MFEIPMGRIIRRKSFLARGEEAEDVRIVNTEGSYVFGPNRKKYIDFMMGWCVGNLGWDQREIKTTIKKFKGPDYVYPGYRYKAWDELAELLAEITPGKLAKCFRATGGTEAVDIALQAAMLHTKRGKFLSVEGSYHGISLAALSIGASDNRETYKNLLSNCHKIEPPLDRKAADKIETQLKKRDVAAFIMEPISINLGVLIPDHEFISRVQQLCRRYGTLFIADEVATGFGRTGTLFASEHFELEPDIMCLAKAITGGCGAMGAMATTQAVARSMEKNGNFYSTYGWHPLSAEAAIASIRYMTKHRKRLLGNVQRMSNYFRTRLSAIEFKHPAKLHIRGLAIGVDVEKEDYATKLQERARDEGLLFSIEESRLLLLPALNVEQEAAKDGLDILERCA